MAVKKRKLVPPSSEGGTNSNSQPKANRIKLGKGVKVGSKAKLGEKY